MKSTSSVGTRGVPRCSCSKRSSRKYLDAVESGLRKQMGKVPHGGSSKEVLNVRLRGARTMQGILTLEPQSTVSESLRLEIRNWICHASPSSEQHLGEQNSAAVRLLICQPEGFPHRPIQILTVPTVLRRMSRMQHVQCHKTWHSIRGQVRILVKRSVG